MKKAYYRSIPAWYDESTQEIKGRNWVCDILIDINIWLDVNVFMVDEFPIYIKDDEEKNN